MSLLPSRRSLRRRPATSANWDTVLDTASQAYNSYRRWSGDRDRRDYRRASNSQADETMPPVSSSAVPSSIRQYTKRLLNRKIETKKRLIQINDLTLKYVTWYYTAPLQFIAVGTGRNQRISDKISDVYLKYAISYSHRNNATWEASWLRILIISSDKELPVDVATPLYSSTPGSGGNFNFLLSNDFHQSTGIVDRNDYTVLYDKRIKSQRNLALTNSSPAVHTISKKLTAEAVYAENTTGGVQFQKKKNIYLLFGVSNTGAVVGDDAGVLQSSGYIYYKDG